MKVLIALASSSGQLSGVPRHAINLARCLLSRPEISQVHLVAAPWQQSFVRDAAPCGNPRLHLHTARVGNSALSRNLWFYSHLPKLAAELDADIVHLAYPVPVRSGAFQCPVVVTLHDLYPYDIPDNFGFPKVLFNRAVLRQCLRRANAIACVSQCTLSRLQSLFPQQARKATVVYNSVAARAYEGSETTLPQWSAKPFLLCVAQHRRNKNILLALRVFQRLIWTRRLPAGTQLFIVGIEGPETAAIEDFIATSCLAHSVVLLNGITDAQLQWCYRNCTLLLAPSLIEGFGLPVAEALLAGCRVVCSDIPAFRELASDNCSFVPLGPQQVEAFADAVLATLLKPPPRPVAFPQLSPPVIADEYMRIYSALLPSPTVGRHPSASAPSSAERQHIL